MGQLHDLVKGSPVALLLRPHFNWEISNERNSGRTFAVRSFIKTRRSLSRPLHKHLGGCWRQDLQGSRHHLDFHRSRPDDFAIAMKQGGLAGRQSHTLRTPASHA